MNNFLTKLFQTRKTAAIALLSSTLSLTGCPLDKLAGKGEVHFLLGPVTNGECSILDKDANEIVLAGPVITKSNGAAKFKEVPEDLTWVLVKCSGGTYIDEATGEQRDAIPLRTFANISTDKKFSVTVTPLTEIAVKIIETYDFLTVENDFSTITSNLATAFGLTSTDLVTTVPADMNLFKNTGTPAGRYGAILAALSQLQADLAASSVNEVIDLLHEAIADNGYFDDQTIRSLVLDALENAHLNDRLADNMGENEEFDTLFHNIAMAPLVSQVEYVHADHPDMNIGEAFTKVQANEKSTFEIVGKHLNLRLTVTLAGERCRLRDLQHTHTSHTTSELDLVFAECPSQPVGVSELVVFDGEREEFVEEIEVVDFVAASAATARASASAVASAASAVGTSFVYGIITAEAPGIISEETGEHSYASADLEIFNVAGVEVVLLDSNGNTLQTTTTYDDGYYEFENVAESAQVAIEVKAHIQKVRSTPNVGPKYNFWVRDNTSKTQPRKPYTIKSALITTDASPAGENEINLRAKIGFDAQGNVISEEMRQSAAFSIMRMVKSSVDALEKVYPNLEMPDLNLYWSGKNIAVSGDQSLGQIGTSHYQSQGLAPGVYILGKANSDTDEFDRGVIGHEFGHFLQAKLSVSDNPGGNHGFREFKDPSLAFGEGYGTAIGGLLAGTNIYCDVSGLKQADGFCNDLSQPVPVGEPNGFYSESTVYHLLYLIGNLPGKGIPEFFESVSNLKDNHYSATVFAFLNNYLTANPEVASEVESLMAANNIKTSNPYGILPTGATADPAISATASKGLANEGANDLEQLYLNADLDTVPAPDYGEPSNILTSTPPAFCLNHNLKGADSHNGLGMSRRFSFTANFTGGIALRAENELGQEVNIQSTKFTVRDDSGASVTMWGYGGPEPDAYWGEIDVSANTDYSILLNIDEPDIVPKGSHCGYKLILARTY